jgi:hypothetical protein
MSVEIQQGIIAFISSSLTPILSFLYPFSISISFPPFSHIPFPSLSNYRNNEKNQPCYGLYYFTVFITYIKVLLKAA